MRKHPLLIGGFVLLALIAGAVSIPLLYVHQHCIIGAWFVLRNYADEHGGRFPEHAQGFGDAIKLAMPDAGNADYQVFCGPGGGVRWLLSDADIDETHASRIYVQGLTEKSDGGIALLFDRYSTPGGDHWRSPWGKPLREVITVQCGGVTVVTDAEWPDFVSRQIELLTKEGIPRETAVKLYEMTGWRAGR